MRPGNRTPLSAEDLADLRAAVAAGDDRIDTSDAPERTDWTGAVRGKFYRPVKEQLTLRIDADLIDWFKRQGDGPRGYQTRINAALRAYVETKQSERG